jgi:hypothetical protein
MPKHFRASKNSAWPCAPYDNEEVSSFLTQALGKRGFFLFDPTRPSSNGAYGYDSAVTTTGPKWTNGLNSSFYLNLGFTRNLEFMDF